MGLRIDKDLFPICWLPFCLIDNVRCLTETLQFYEVHLPILDLTAQAINVLFRNFSLVPISSKLFPTFSSLSFSVSGFMWNSLNHLDLSFVQEDKNRSIHILLHVKRQLCQHFVENAVSFPLDGFSSLVKDQVIIGVWVHFWVFSSIPLIYLSVTVPVLYSFYHNCSIVQLIPP